MSRARLPVYEPPEPATRDPYQYQRIENLAECLDVSERTIRRWISSGTSYLEVIKIGRTVRVALRREKAG